MPNLSRLWALSVRERGLVAVAVLLDGHDAADYLTSDKERHVALSRVAKDLAEIKPELRLPLLGTLLRDALKGIDEVQQRQAIVRNIS